MHEPTLEMVNWFRKRTDRHINMVKKYARLIDDLNIEEFDGIMDRVEVHDQSKYEEPEYTPYVFVVWTYYAKDNNIPFDPPEGIDDAMNDATVHHILNNPHHPEYHDPNFDPETMFNNQDRDRPSDVMVDGSLMTDLDIAEMVADWCAVGEERGNSPIEWADKNVNIRWKFKARQRWLIYWLIEKIWNN